jgi:hypothetical protein
MRGDGASEKPRARTVGGGAGESSELSAELELMVLLADHPSLIATVDADKAFWLLTDARLRDMYSAARDGQSFHELVSVHLPPNTAKYVLSGKYVTHTDPEGKLRAMTANLETAKRLRDRHDTAKLLVEAKRRSNDREFNRRVTELVVAERNGDWERAAQLRAELETSNGKQVE